MTTRSVIRSFKMADGRKVVSLDPEAMRIAVKAAMSPKSGKQSATHGTKSAAGTSGDKRR